MFNLDMSLNPTFIFIDGSYYCYHRFYSLMRWWKKTYPEISLDEPFQNTEFVEKFTKTFVEHIKNIPKKLHIHKLNPIIIVGKDCRRENIWRNELLPTYKGNRDNSNFKGGPFFKLAYENDYFQKGGAKIMLNHPKLEGDDCIAITVKYLLKKYPECNIYIITSDRDYLQLVSNNVNIYDLSFKPLRTNGNSENDLEIKIIIFVS
jgi:5'-3' exonuclease